MLKRGMSNSLSFIQQRTSCAAIESSIQIDLVGHIAINSLIIINM